MGPITEIAYIKAMNYFKKSLLEKAEAGYIYLTIHGGGKAMLRKSYTLCTELIPEEDLPVPAHQNHKMDRKNICLYDTIGGKFVELWLDHIVTLFAYHDKNRKHHLDHHQQWVDEYNESMEYAKECKCTTDQHDLDKCYFAHVPEVFKLLCMFDHEIEEEDLKDRDISEEKMEHARVSWMNLIRKYRAKSFVELDQLEEEAKKDDTSEIGRASCRERV